MKSGYLIVRRITKCVKVKCTINSSWAGALPQTPLGGAYSAAQTPNWTRGAYFYREGWKGLGMGGKAKRRG